MEASRQQLNFHKDQNQHADLYIVQRLSSLNVSPPQECPHFAMADALHLTCNHLKYCADSYRALILIRQECHPLYLC